MENTKHFHSQFYNFIFDVKKKKKMEVISVAQTAVEEILSESRMAILAMLRSSKLLPLLMRRLNFSQDALRLSGSSVNLADIKWPLICDFSVEGIVERIRDYITLKWHLSERDDVQVACVATTSIDNIELYHFKAILRKPLKDKFRVRLPMAGTAPIYFLVEISLNQEHSAQVVTVTYKFAGTNSVHLLSSSAQTSSTLE